MVTKSFILRRKNPYGTMSLCKTERGVRMKIAVIGYSGSGKSTLAAALGQKYGIPVLHLDRVQYLPGWAIRDREDGRAEVAAFMEQPEWVIDGNYTKYHYESRLAQADRIYMLLFSRFACLRRVIKRYRQYRGKVRESIADGCEEKLDREFIRWVLWGGRRSGARARYRSVRELYPDKVTVIRNQRQLDQVYKNL